MATHILPLPEEVRCQLRSGVAIASVAQCVEELVLNSLDAGATCVAVRVDLSIFKIQVVDNGEGVSHADLKYLGRRHATSKCRSLKDLNSNLSHYGFRGEALASIVNLSAIVDITTRPQGTPRTLTKLFTFGKERSVTTAKLNRPSAGTTVTIQEFMHNMPVRQKLVREAIDVESIRMRLESFALMHPKVAFSLRNDRTNSMVVQTKKSSGTLATFLQLFGVDRAQAMAEVHHSLEPFTVWGYIGTQPHLTKALQYVYINKRLVLKTKIHRMLNDLLARSSIISARLHPSSVGSSRTPSSPPKGMRLYGMFVLNIECPYSEYDICLDPSKTLVEFKDWDQLLLCTEELVLKFASEENLVISLDERFRRSGKEQEEGEEDEEKLSSSQSSQSCLQVFSLKRGCEGSKEGEGPNVKRSREGSREDEGAGPAKQRYGRTLNTQDNLLAVHSAMVRRGRKETKVPGEDKERNSDIDEPDSNKDAMEEFTDKGDDNSDPPQGDDESISDATRNEVKKRKDHSEGNSEDRGVRTHNKDSHGDAAGCVEGTAVTLQGSPSKRQAKHKSSASHSFTKFEESPVSEGNNPEGNHVSESSEGEEGASFAEKRRQGVRSVLEEFRKVLEEVNEKDESTDSDLDRAIALSESSSHQEGDEDGDGERDRTKCRKTTLSTLEELMNFHKREQECSVQEGYKTPEEDVRGTPTTPPPLRPPRLSSPPPPPLPPPENEFTAKTCTQTQPSSAECERQRKCNCNAREKKASESGPEKRVTRESLREDRSWKNKSLSKSLSEKFKSHQNMTRSLLSLQRFGYRKTNPAQSSLQAHSGVRENVCRDRSTVGSEVKSSVVRPVECQRVSTDTLTEHAGGRSSSERHDTSFKFDPVITRTSREVDPCLSHLHSCREKETTEVPLGNDRAVDVLSQEAERTVPNPTGTFSEGGGGGGDCDGGGGGVSVSKQLSTPPRQSSSLLHIAENYASTPEDSDGTPEKPGTPDASLRVPRFLGFEGNLVPRPGTSSGHLQDLGGACGSVDPSVKCGGGEAGNTSAQTSQVENTSVGRNTHRILDKPLIDSDTFQDSDALKKFPRRSDLFSEKTPSNCEKDDLVKPPQRGETQVKAFENYLDSHVVERRESRVKVSENYLAPRVAPCSPPVTQSFEVSEPVTQQDAHTGRQEVEDLQECVHRVQPSEGFTPSSNDPLAVQRLSGGLGSDPWVPVPVPVSSQQVQEAVSSGGGGEKVNKEVFDRASDSKVPASCSQIIGSEMPLENKLPLPALMNVESSSAGVCRLPAPAASVALEAQPLPPSQQGMSELEDDGPASQTSQNPFSESLHFSQLTLPDEGSNKTSDGTLPNLSTVPDSSTLSLGLPVTCHSSLPENSEPQRKKMCDITFQGKVIQIGKRRESQSGSGEAGRDSDHERMRESDSSDTTTLEPTRTLPSDPLPVVQSEGVTRKNPETSEHSSRSKDSESHEESDQREGPVHHESKRHQDLTQDLTGDLKSSRHGTSGEAEGTRGTQPLPQDGRWREAVDKEGRTVYVDLQTGNSSYEPLEVKDGPAWTSSQPLGAPLPKVPLTHEPWYIPRGKGQRDRDSFTLSHGFAEFVSLKKTIETRKRESAGRANAPSGTSQEVQEAIESLLQDSEADADLVKWTEKPESALQAPARPSEVARICRTWEPPDFAMDAEVLNAGPEAGLGPQSVSGVRTYNVVHPYRFSQEMLQSCKVIGQLDQKFIACSLTYQNPDGPPGSPESELVVLFDQHAVHERVRLESIIRDNCETLDTGETVLGKNAVIPPMELNLPEDEVRLMQAYSEKFNQRGLYFTRASPSKVLFQLIPSCLVPKEANEARQKRCQAASAIVESVVRDLCHTLHQTGGVLGLIPRPITHVFNSNACRGAIKFGDELTTEECQDLISSLSSCQLPFQCAHGRPSIVPLVNLTHLAARTPKRTSKPNLKKLREAMEAGAAL